MNHRASPLSPTARERLPIYFRALRMMLLENQLRATSSDLSHRTGYSAAQIRSDLKSFAGAGQRGYGYSVKELYTDISSALGLAAGLRAVCIGSPDMRPTMESLCGRCGVRILSIIPPETPLDQIRRAVDAEKPDIGIILHRCLEPQALCDCLIEGGVSGILNYTDQTLISTTVPIRNCALSDALLLITADIQAERGEA